MMKKIIVIIFLLITAFSLMLSFNSIVYSTFLLFLLPIQNNEPPINKTHFKRMVAGFMLLYLLAVHQQFNQHSHQGDMMNLSPHVNLLVYFGIVIAHVILIMLIITLYPDIYFPNDAKGISSDQESPDPASDSDKNAQDNQTNVDR